MILLAHSASIRAGIRKARQPVKDYMRDSKDIAREIIQEARQAKPKREKRQRRYRWNRRIVVQGGLCGR